MTLNDFKHRIDAGGGACRIDHEANDSALVFSLDGVYYVGGIGERAAECWTWADVLANLGEWALYGGWQPYRMAYQQQGGR